jgi:hypothetical protein
VEPALARAQRRTGAGGLLEEMECREDAEEVSSSVDRSHLPVPLLPLLFLLLSPLLAPGVEDGRLILHQLACEPLALAANVAGHLRFNRS